MEFSLLVLAFSSIDKNSTFPGFKALLPISPAWLGYTDYYYKDKHIEKQSLKPGSLGFNKTYETLKNNILELKKLGKKVYIILDMPCGGSFDPKHMLIRNPYGSWEVSIKPLSRIEWDNMRFHILKKFQKLQGQF